MRKDRLLKLAEFCDSPPANAPLFNMNYWCSCGAGYATLVQSLDELHLTKGSGIAYKSRKGYGAVEMFFGMTRDQVRKLFRQSGNPSRSPEQFARSIYRFLGAP